MNAATPNASRIDSTLTTIGQPALAATSFEEPMPRSTPIRPPTMEIGILSGADPVTLPEDRIDFALRLLHGIGRSRRNEEHVDLRLAAETLHDRGVRREDRVVLVLPHQVAALALEHSHDFERHVL